MGIWCSRAVSWLLVFLTSSRQASASEHLFIVSLTGSPHVTEEMYKGGPGVVPKHPFNARWYCWISSFFIKIRTFFSL